MDIFDDIFDDNGDIFDDKVDDKVDDIFYDILNCTDEEIIPRAGTFIFVKNYFIRNSLIHDYKFFDNIDSWNLLKKYNQSDIFWTYLQPMCYQYHTKKTYQNNLKFLEYIAINGWTEFVIKIICNFNF